MTHGAWRTRACAVLVAVTATACGGGRDVPDAAVTETATTRERPASPAVPVLCGEPRPRVRVTGRVTAPAATELSGLAFSHRQSGVLWAVNDSGNPPRLLAIASDGRLRADLAVTGAQNADWEDLAVGPAPGSGDAVYIADIGDNDRRRDTVVVYRVPEPQVAAGAAATAPATAFVLRYPDGAHDAEALLVDPRSGALVIVTKSLGGRSAAYVARRPSPGATTTLRRAGALVLGLGDLVTAGDVSADGRALAVRTYDRAFVWRRRAGEGVAAALRRRPCVVDRDLLVEGQGETLALRPRGDGFVTVPEGERPAVRRYLAARR